MGVTAVWERLCGRCWPGCAGSSAAEVAVEHALSEGIRIGLDVHRRGPGRQLPADGVLLAGAEHEAHCLGLHAVAAALREQGRGCLHLGPALPWAALTVAPCCGPVRVPSWSGRRRRSPAARTGWSASAATSRGTGVRRRAGVDRAVPAPVDPADQLLRRAAACGVPA